MSGSEKERQRIKEEDRHGVLELLAEGVGGGWLAIAQEIDQDMDQEREINQDMDKERHQSQGKTAADGNLDVPSFEHVPSLGVLSSPVALVPELGALAARQVQSTDEHHTAQWTDERHTDAQQHVQEQEDTRQHQHQLLHTPLHPQPAREVIEPMSKGSSKPSAVPAHKHRDGKALVSHTSSPNTARLTRIPLVSPRTRSLIHSVALPTRPAIQTSQLQSESGGEGGERLGGERRQIGLPLAQWRKEWNKTAALVEQVCAWLTSDV